MGVSNRDYMRDDGRRALFSAGRITWWIIGINAVLWVVFSGAYHQRGGPPWQDPAQAGGLYGFLATWFELHPRDVVGSFRVWQPFTCFWLHDPAGVRHVLWNMLLLYFFGREAESSLGRNGYLRLYLGGGLLASLVFMLWAFLVGSDARALGASGAVYAVMVWTACRSPRRTVLLMFVLPVPLWLLVGGLMVGGELYGLAASGFRDGAAVAHLGGAAWGLFTWIRLARVPTFSKRGPGSWIVDLKRKRKRGSGGGQPPPDRKAERAQVERLLQKISDEGIGALSEAEKRFLQDASRRYL
jgi:membrane associated rhomboid family serine protease